MALPMLINGAECGPSNPLQSLAKRFDQDRGIQQDQFVSGRAGPSRETFRTQQASNPSLNQEASQFFASNSPQVSHGPPTIPSPFDLSLLRSSLPSPHSGLASPILTPSPQAQAQKSPGLASWASDFMKQANVASPSQASVLAPAAASTQMEMHREAQPFVSAMNAGPSSQWFPGNMGMMQTGPQWSAAANMPLQSIASRQVAAPLDSSLWDKEFLSHEAALVESQPQIVQETPAEQQAAVRPDGELDDLARTAAQLIEAVKDEQNPKFKNSKFLGLMRQLRDGDVVVDGNDMVERSEASARSTETDAKGKGKARETYTNFNTGGSAFNDPSASSYIAQRAPVNMASGQWGEELEQETNSRFSDEDENEAYFRRENEEYINYWDSQGKQAEIPSLAERDSSDWDSLQDSWDSFEATTWGVKPVDKYNFQPHNPYLHAERTRHHSMHARDQSSLYESVLELEAAVQRDPTSARAWFDLGVKQQENEREGMAITALKRALALDPTHLPSWLALAISHTNENDRVAADDAIEQWVQRNTRYAEIVNAFHNATRALNGSGRDGDAAQGAFSQARRHSELVDCLMTMARSENDNGVIDADVQIALAVLLNTNEEYEKAQDCFRAALSVRPDEWQLYNRVGATLANSGRAQEALQFYYKALELNPAYIRARFNLGISCINMKRYEEAAHHILDALVLQDSDGSVYGSNDTRGITSAALWDSLKTTCVHLQRIDLASMCERRDLDGFRREFTA